MVSCVRMVDQAFKKHPDQNHGTKSGDENSTPDAEIFIPPQNICQYAVLDLAGVGSNSNVYKAVSPNVAFSSPIRNIAMKRYQKERGSNARREIEVLTALKGFLYTVNYYGAFNFNGELVLAMELFGPNLKHHSLLSDSNASSGNGTSPSHDVYTSWAKLAKQLLLAVVAVNSKGYIHGDLEPAHVLLEANQKRKIKIVGFSNSLKIRDLCKFGGRSGHADMFTDIQPNIGYRAPEILLGDPSFDGKIDIWSVGVILLELYINNIFSNQRNDWRLINPNCNQQEAVETLVASFGSIDSYPTPESTLKLWKPGINLRAKENSPPNVLSILVSDKTGVKNGAIVFLLSLLSLDRKKRPTATEALRHPFLTRQLLGDWSKYIIPVKPDE